MSKLPRCIIAAVIWLDCDEAPPGRVMVHSVDIIFDVAATVSNSVFLALSEMT